jgi:hypothetical protein
MKPDEHRLSSSVSEVGSADRLELPGGTSGDPHGSEDAALALLQRADAQAVAIEELTKNSAAMSSRKVKLAVVKHPRTPRHISLPVLRQLFTFDLMNVALVPTVSPDIKNAAEDVLINRIESIAIGERMALARRASGKVARALLDDKDIGVMNTALDNSRLTEALLIKAVSRGSATAQLVDSACHHTKWSRRRDVRIALLRSGKTPLACALAFARTLPASTVKEVLHGSRLPSGTQRYLRAELHIPEPD